MYRISPFRPVSEIVEGLLALEQYEAASVLARSASYAVRDGSPEAMLRLAPAYYVWSDTRLDGATMAEIVEVMRTQGVRLSDSDVRLN